MSRTAAPRLAVVVRTLGASARLDETLASLAAQTWRDFEEVVVDMSPAGAPPVRPARAGMPRVTHLRIGRRLARPVALNTGIRATRAAHVAVLDDDNLYDPDHLGRLMAALERTGADWVYTGVRHATFTPGGALVARREVAIPFDFEVLLLGNFVYACGSAYRRSLWATLGGYDERFAVFEDWEFLVRAAQVGRIVHEPGVSAESRKFTGVDGVANFDREVATVRRCLAGVYWKHRRLYRGERRRRMKAAAAGHCARRVPPRTGLLARSVAGWRVELAWDLAAWWWWQARARVTRAAA